MSNNSGREALRGEEVHMLDVIFELLTSQQWAAFLTAPLEHAAAKGNRELAQKLVRAGAEIGDALHEAVRGGHGKIVNDLLEKGASLAAKDGEGDTPLHVAAQRGRTKMVKQLLREGADTDAFAYGEWTPLSLAALQGHRAATQALLTAGADVSLQCSEMKFTALHIAAKMGRVEILRAVIEHGADVDAVADTDKSVALHYAASNNHAEVVDVLVEAGANIEAVDEFGLTPLHCASGGLGLEALLCLLKHGATINAPYDGLRTPLMYAAATAGTPGAAELVDSLLRAGADETIVDYDGNKAADVIATNVDDEEDPLVEDIERVRELLANAPADRAWRRRGYLTMCRAHPDRMQQTLEIIGINHTNTVRRWTRSRAKLADESAEGNWTVVVTKVLRLQEEDIFRTIAAYL